jgi:hypothetical protein
MSGILGKFQVEHDIRGARVIARTHQLTGDCVGEAEIELAIQMLKDDLDACGKEMKRLVELSQRGSQFEGWPKDQVLDA